MFHANKKCAPERFNKTYKSFVIKLLVNFHLTRLKRIWCQIINFKSWEFLWIHTRLVQYIRRCEDFKFGSLCLRSGEIQRANYPSAVVHLSTPNGSGPGLSEIFFLVCCTRRGNGGSERAHRFSAKIVVSGVVYVVAPRQTSTLSYAMRVFTSLVLERDDERVRGERYQNERPFRIVVYHITLLNAITTTTRNNPTTRYLFQRKPYKPF